MMVASSYRVQDDFIFGSTMSWAVLERSSVHRDVEHLNESGTERRLLPVEIVS
ncbi:MAG: hypothetical protein WCK53_13715 [Methanomicrobiales archaeon]